jgi:hypothetical protein
LFLCAFIIDRPKTKNLKVEHEKRKQLLHEELQKFLSDLDRASGTLSLNGILIPESGDDGGMTSEEVVLEFGARGTSLLQGFARISWEQELIEELTAASGASGGQEGLWSKVQNMFR